MVESTHIYWFPKHGLSMVKSTHYLLVSAAWSSNIWWYKHIFTGFRNMGLSTFGEISTYLLVSATWDCQHLVKSAHIYWFPQHAIVNIWWNQPKNILVPATRTVNGEINTYLLVSATWTVNGRINTYPLARPLVSSALVESTHICSSLRRTP